MKSFRFALAALALSSSPLLAAPAEGPTRYLTGSDLFNLEVATDPQISPDGRTIVYVRKSNDIMTDKARQTIWSVDVATGEQHPLLAGPGFLLLAAMVAEWTAARLCCERWRQPAIVRALDGERRKRADHRAA
jgi:hypothetical protein